MIYEYACDDCRVRCEVEKSIKQSSREELCPRCGLPLRRCYSPVPVIFKDAGFPGNDMRTGGGVSRLGRKPSHAEYEQVEATYPDPKRAEDLL